MELADREIGVLRSVKAVAVLTAADVRRSTLDGEALEPPARHANIIGWPGTAGDPDQTRAQRKVLALLLVQAATLIRR